MAESVSPPRFGRSPYPPRREDAHASGASSSNNVDRPANTEAAMRREHAEALIEELRSKDPVVRPRPRLRGLHPVQRLPASEASEYAKHEMTQDQRTSVTEALMNDLRRPDVSASQTRDALDALEPIWHAQLQIHTPAQRKWLRLEQTLTSVAGVMLSLPTLGTVTAGALVSLRDSRHDYNRSPARPEYQVALNEMMDVMQLGHLCRAARQRVAALLLDRHMRDAPTLAPLDHNAVVRAISPDDDQSPLPGYLAIQAPTRGTPDVENRRQNTIIALAESGYRALTQTPEATGPRPKEKIAKIDDISAAFDGLPERDLHTVFGLMPPGEAQNPADHICGITLEPIQKVIQAGKMGVALYKTAAHAKNNSQMPAFYDFEALVPWLNTDGRDPIRRFLVDATNVSKVAVRLTMPAAGEFPSMRSRESKP